MDKVHCSRCGSEGIEQLYGEIKVTHIGSRGYCPHYWRKKGEKQYAGGGFGRRAQGFRAK